MPRVSRKNLTAEVKEAALKFGVHLVGITGVDRIANAPEGFRATDIMPEAKSVVVMCIGLPQGVDAQPYHVIEFFDNAWNVADVVAVGIVKALRINLVKYGIVQTFGFLVANFIILQSNTY